MDHVKVKKLLTELGTDRSIPDRPAQTSDQDLLVNVAGSARPPVADRPPEDDLLTDGAGENKPPVVISDGQIYGG